MNSAMVVTFLILGVPAVALSFRLVMKPIIDAWVRTREAKLAAADPERERLRDERIAAIEAGMAALHAETAELRHQLQRLSAVEGFYKELRSPEPTATGSLPPGLNP